MMEPTKGSNLGNYRLISPLGAGGFADVYLGEHIYLETRAAIKVLHVSFEPASEVLDRFLTEARTIAQLRHPNIVGILEFGVEHDLPYLVMEYAPHGSLRTKHPRGSILPLATVLSYIQQVAAALQYAHEHRVVHCDVKPENMLLDQDDRVLLSDFGIARVVQNTMQTQEVVGTIYYMAPEQFDGKPLPASDQYALGVVVYQWLCGHLPFEGGNLGEIFVKHTQKPPPSMRERALSIPPAIEQVVLKALAKEAQQRFPDVATFAAAFEDAAQSTFTSGVLGLPPASSLVSPSSGKNASSHIGDAAAFSVGAFPDGDSSMASPSTLGSNDAGATDEILPLLPSMIDAVAPVVNLLGEPTEPVEPTVSQAPVDLLVAPPAEQSSGASQWNVPAKASSNDSDHFSISLPSSSSGLLPSLADEQKDLTQDAAVPVSPSAQDEPSDSLLLTSISDSLPSSKALTGKDADASISPRSPTLKDPMHEPSSKHEPIPIVDPIRANEVVRPLFFISYDKSNRDWARWIAWHLQQAGFSVVPFEKTAQPGTNVAAEMQVALKQAENVIAVISLEYLQVRSNQGDWKMISMRDDANEQSKVLLACVQDCGQPFEQLLHTSDYINLIGLNKQAANATLLDGVQEQTKLVFPGGQTPISLVTTPEPPLPPNPPPPQQIEIFISYSHLDKNYREALRKHLSPLKTIYPTTFWYDGVIRPGVNFEQEIEIHLRNAHIILLLVSPDFIDSEYCSVKELGPAMERHHKGEARVIPIILRPTFWKGTPFRKLQALPNNGKPITEWSRRDAAYLTVVEGIEKVIKDILRKP